jgi:hypothetical protein
MKISVIKEQGREVNPFSKYPKNPVHRQWAQFEQSVITYPAPGMPDCDEVEAELQWQEKHPMAKGWVNVNQPDNKFSSIVYKTRQVWRLSTPSKKEAEVKHVTLHQLFLDIINKEVFPADVDDLIELMSEAYDLGIKHANTI